MPNWKKFQGKVYEMIDTTLGAMECVITTPVEITYDFINGETETQQTNIEVKAALIPINKDDLKDLPEGLREKATRKVFTKEPISRNATITSVFDNTEFQVVMPSAPMTAGGMVHCYKTFIGKIENITNAPQGNTGE